MDQNIQNSAKLIIAKITILLQEIQKNKNNIEFELLQGNHPT